MAKEFMSDRDKNPKYYERATCSECDTDQLLVIHRYNGSVMCVSCLEMIVSEIARIAEEENEKEGYYTDYSYNQLIQEREA